MSNSISKRYFRERSQLDKALAKHVSRLLQEGIARRGRAVLAVSGGSTPKGFFGVLSVAEIQWDKVVITLTDERWVSTDSDESNEKLVRTHLIKNNAANAQFVGIKVSDVPLKEGVLLCNQALGCLGTSDVCVLGMGLDAHTASIFPDNEMSKEAMTPQHGADYYPVITSKAPVERVTMTLPRILDTRQIIVHLTGEDKRTVLERALNAEDRENMPISAVLHQTQTPVEIYWSP